MQRVHPRIRALRASYVCGYEHSRRRHLLGSRGPALFCTSEKLPALSSPVNPHRQRSSRRTRVGSVFPRWEQKNAPASLGAVCAEGGKGLQTASLWSRDSAPIAMSRMWHNSRGRQSFQRLSIFGEPVPVLHHATNLLVYFRAFPDIPTEYRQLHATRLQHGWGHMQPGSRSEMTSRFRAAMKFTGNLFVTTARDRLSRGTCAAAVFFLSFDGG
jgi:hypothetical protein